MKNSLIVSAISILMSVVTPAFAAGDIEAGKTKSVVCGACHGADGKAMLPTYPNLAGQGEAYITKQLNDFISGARSNPLMSPMAAPLSEEDIADLAAYFSSMPSKEGVAAEENIALGESIFRGGITSVKIPACTGCHGPDGAGNSAAAYPALSGQNTGYVDSTLKGFRSGARANDPAEMMRDVAHRLTDAEIAAVSNYIQGLH